MAGRLELGGRPGVLPATRSAAAAHSHSMVAGGLLLMS
jgi:hypothetical protein